MSTAEGTRSSAAPRHLFVIHTDGERIWRKWNKMLCWISELNGLNRGWYERSSQPRRSKKILGWWEGTEGAAVSRTAASSYMASTQFVWLDFGEVKLSSQEQASSLLVCHLVPWCEAYLKWWCEGLGCQCLLSSWRASVTRKQYCPFALGTEEWRALGPWHLLGQVERDPQESRASSSGTLRQGWPPSLEDTNLHWPVSKSKTSQYTLGLLFA